MCYLNYYIIYIVRFIYFHNVIVINLLCIVLFVTEWKVTCYCNTSTSNIIWNTWSLRGSVYSSILFKWHRVAGGLRSRRKEQDALTLSRVGNGKGLSRDPLMSSQCFPRLLFSQWRFYRGGMGWLKPPQKASCHPWKYELWYLVYTLYIWKLLVPPLAHHTPPLEPPQIQMCRTATVFSWGILGKQ